MSRGTKFNQGKPRMSLIPAAPMRAIAMVLNYGEKKYHAYNWAMGIPFSDLLDACERHIGYFKDGENLDKESGLHHIAHAAFYMIAILWFMFRDQKELDDRYIKDDNGWGNDFNVPMNEPKQTMADGGSVK